MLRLKVVALLVAAGITVAACGSGTKTSSSGGSPAAATTPSANGASGSSSGTATSSPGSSASNPLKGKTIAFANFTDGVPLFVAFQKGLVAAAAHLGVHLKIYNNNADPTTTLNNAKLIAQSKPDFVLEYDPIASTSKAVHQVFQQAGLPCIAVNVDESGGCPWLNLRPDVVSGQAGKEIGIVAKKRGWSGANTKVVLFDDAPAGPQIQAQIGYFYKGLTSELPGLAPIGSYKDLTATVTKLGSTTLQANDDSDPTKTYPAMKSLLQQIPSNDNIIVYTTTDDGDAAALRAINQAGRSGGALTVGIVGSATALKGMQSNPKEWAGTGEIFYENWGEYLFAMAQAILTHKPTPDMTSGPDAILATTNLTVPGTEIVPVSTYYHSGQTQPFKLPPLVPVKQGTVGLNTGSVGNSYLGDTGILKLFGNVTGQGGQ